MIINNIKGIRRIIALFALLLLGDAYASGYVNPEYENITYKFESIYPDIETMNRIEESFTDRESIEQLDKQIKTVS